MICVFCFYNISSGPQARFAFDKDFKHCNIICYDGSSWIATEFDLTGVLNRRIQVYSGPSLLRGLKYIPSLISIVTVMVEEKKKVCWKPFMVRSCNELDRYISGVDIGFTFNPKHLYNKLLKHEGSNYQILHLWRR